MQEAKFSTNFKMYRGKTEFLHTARSEETPARHLEDVIKYVEACVGHGFRDEPGNGKEQLAEDERKLPVDGYIAAKTNPKSDGSVNYVLWLYGPTSKFRIVAVYTEKWGELAGWFDPDVSRLWPTRSTPEAPEARSSDLFIPVPRRDCIIRSYTNKDGDPRKTLERVLSPSVPPVSPPAAAPPVTSAASGEAAKLADTIVNGVQTGATTPQLLVSFGERAMLRRPEVGTEWARVQNVFRSKLVPMRYQFSRDAMLDAIEKLRQLLGEVHYADLKSSFAEGDSDVPF